LSGAPVEPVFTTSTTIRPAGGTSYPDGREDLPIRREMPARRARRRVSGTRSPPVTRRAAARWTAVEATPCPPVRRRGTCRPGPVAVRAGARLTAGGPDRPRRAASRTGRRASACRRPASRPPRVRWGKSTWDGCRPAVRERRGFVERGSSAGRDRPPDRLTQPRRLCSRPHAKPVDDGCADRRRPSSEVLR